MRVGYPHWHTVASDTAGVPHGGPFGDVRRFESSLNAHGLKLAWSRVRNCFGIYSQRGPHCTWQFLCQTGGKALPLNDTLLWLMLYYWNRHARTTTATIKEALAQGQRDYQYKLRAEAEAERRGILRDVARDHWRHRSRPVISLPRVIVPRGRV